MLKKNQTVKLEIESISNDGSGVARLDGMAVFVPMTAPGDVAEVKIVKTLKTHAFGVLCRIETPSPLRVDPGCPVYRLCGGCSLRHIDYEAELGIKSGWVKENLRRLSRVDIELDRAIPSPCHGRYRNKAQYPVRMLDGEMRAGFFRARSHGLVPIGDCALQPEVFSGIVGEVLAFCRENGVTAYDESTNTGVLRHVFLRRAETSGEIMLCLIINARRLAAAGELVARLKTSYPGVTTVTVNINRERTNVIFGEKALILTGSGIITDELCGVKLGLSAQSFYQVNRAAAERLYLAAREYAALNGDDVLLDLYCGAGAVGLSMAAFVRELIGVETSEPAVLDARRNAAQNGISNARFLCADAGEAAARLAGENVKVDVVVVDPPRKGLAPEIPVIIARLKPKRLVYISCDSATLARDAARLNELGFAMTRARAVDLFPRTAHIEAVALFENNVKT